MVFALPSFQGNLNFDRRPEPHSAFPEKNYVLDEVIHSRKFDRTVWNLRELRSHPNLSPPSLEGLSHRAALQHRRHVVLIEQPRMRRPFTIQGLGNTRQLVNKSVQAGPRVARRKSQSSGQIKAAPAVPEVKQEPVTSAPSKNGSGQPSIGRQDLEVDSVLAKELHDNGTSPLT